MTTDARTVSRRAAVGGMGLAGVAGVAAALSAATPAHAQEPASMQVTTLAELRAATTADTGASYYVTDLGQEGPFRYDATDTSSADNTGTVVVSGAGHRFKRVIGGELRLSWFGAKADYNPRTGNGTPADNALELALGALQAFSALAPLNRGSRRGLPTIVFDAGNYVFRQPGHLVQWATGITGLHLEGQGIYQSNVYLDMDQAVHGAENHFLVNDGTDTANLGVVNNYSVDGLTFFGVTGTERFMRYADTAGAGVAKRMYFSRCSWNDLAVGFDIRGDVNSDHIRFLDCIIQDHSTDAVFFRADNPQSQNHDFVDCNFETRGIVLEFIAGGNLHVRGCQITVYETGVFLKIGDPAGSGIGIGAGTFNLTDINPEIKDEAKLLEVHAPEARVTLVNPRLVTGLAQTIADWTDGTTYPVDTRVGAGVAGHLTTHSKQQAFKCIQAHTASAVNRPRTGPDWEQYWQPLYEIHINAGAVDIRGGSLALSTIMRYESGAHDRPWPRGQLTVRDGCRLVNPISDMVDIVPVGTVSEAASKPRVLVTGCRPYTGGAFGAFGSTPHDPVDVSLNAQHGFEGAALPIARFVFTANPGEGEGLPAASDGEQTFLLPRGAQVLRAEVVSNTVASADPYRITNHDDSVVLLPAPNDGNVRRRYQVDSEAARMFKVSSTAAERADGFLLIEYF